MCIEMTYIFNITNNRKQFPRQKFYYLMTTLLKTCNQRLLNLKNVVLHVRLGFHHTEKFL
jgi:hypothetical protein